MTEHKYINLVKRLPLQQNMNDFLRGRGRGLPKAARAKLAKYFKVTPQIFELVDALALT